ncbi:MAG: WYL domain-containing protein [Actinobacteria bacterium]|jgi:proteasome accessory factor B|nr:WYL domain-containing protein [Actinomycetota bacterium]NDH12439.1 WYL domain-containing protein [Actinomycetota bacterium]
MPIEKAERLINLTMALLAAQRYIKKSQIFAIVAGYSGNAEAMERMFERDKDDLRNLGIVIEVGGLDPLFDDEPGYRIKQSEYALALENLTAEELSLLAVAAKTWQDATFSNSAQSALRKLRSLGIENDATNYVDAPFHIKISNSNFALLWNATIAAQILVFEYPDHTNRLAEREIQPYGIAAWRGQWYLVGRDVAKDAIRVFKVARIALGCKVRGKVGAFQLPIDFDISHHLVMLQDRAQTPVILQVRKDRCHGLRQKSKIIRNDAEWDELEFIENNRPETIQEILWYSPDVIVISPKDLKMAVVTSLQEMAKNG